MGETAGALLVATMDTKPKEALLIKETLEEAGACVRIMDAGIMGQSPVPVTVTREEVAAAAGWKIEDVRTIGHEGRALEVMVKGAIILAGRLYDQGLVDGVIGLGGSMGTTLGSSVMRSLPFGLPKVMISTMASRDTRAFIGTRDIMMLHSICDLSGLNRVTKRTLINGARAMSGMLGRPVSTEPGSGELVFLTTLGTTEVTAKRIQARLSEEGKEVVTFHTVGSGGKAMEEMIALEEVTALIDLSLHEMVDHRFGGDYDAGPDRGRAALKKGIPTVVVPGNIDFLVSGPLESAKQKFPGRAIHSHNAAISTIRSSREEIDTMAAVLAEILNEAKRPFRVVIPLGGLSAFDSDGGPLRDAEAPLLFAEKLNQHLIKNEWLTTLPHHINDEVFSKAILEALAEML